jgi:hypothetical protein
MNSVSGALMRATSRPSASFGAVLVVVVVDDEPGADEARRQQEHVVVGLVGHGLRVSRLDRRRDGLGRHVPRDGGHIGLLPALEFVGEDRQRASEADHIDKGGEGEPEGRMPRQHGAHKVRRQQRRPLARFLGNEVIHHERTFGRKAMA